MDDYRLAVAAESARLVADLPAQVARVHALVQQRFPARSPSAARAKFAAQLEANPSQLAVNDEVTALVALAADELDALLRALQQLQLWISLLVPKIEDGNNFGVEVQKAAFTVLKEHSATWQKQFDSLSDYAQQRATAVEKLNAKRSSEKTTTATKSTGGKDGDEDKRVVSAVDKESSAAADVPDWRAYVLSLDVKWYCNLARALEGVRDTYATAFDVIDKNKDKVERPRGQGDRAGFSMF